MSETSKTTGYALGSGALSSSFSGDKSGTYSVAGPLVSDQVENPAVGAIFTPGEDVTTGGTIEGFSILGFHPTGNGKADIFILGTKTDAPLTSIEPGVTYGIGSFAPFTAVFFVGVNIQDFWAQADLVESSDSAFQLAVGDMNIAVRDSMYVSGTFSGTTDPNRSTLSKSFILK
jgi:hypothetical protein